MLRFHPIANAKAAESYYSKSDGGQYYAEGELRSEWMGRGAELLGLSGTPDFEQFKRLIHGLDPHTGEQLTAKLIENRIPGWDVTASVPKGVTIALERGDTRVREALWDVARETLADLEEYATTRVRKDYQQDDRRSGNLVAFAVEHAETRPAKADNMPDPDRHIHLVVMNVTYDAKEREWKAVKFRPVMDLRKYFDRRFDLRLSSKLSDLGYAVETRYKGGKYYTWDIRGMPDSVAQKFSRRTAEVDAAEKATIAANKERDRERGLDPSLTPDALSATARDKLGATSRARKRDDLSLADLRRYWDGRVTPEEARQVAHTIKDALNGVNALPENTADQGVRFAIDHHFERSSVVGWHELAVTAMERCMGGATPGQIEPEARRQGMLFKDGQVTTKAVLAEETRIVDFAREGRGAMRPLGGLSADPKPPPDARTPERQAATKPGNILVPLPGGAVAEVSEEQYRVARHVWDSPDRVILVRGAAGTGKTHTMKVTLAGIDAPVAILAPTADASRGVLRDDGFTDADTVASFLRDDKRQERIKGGVIYVDEAGLLPIKDLSALCDIAKEKHARLVLQGDPKQHKSVLRNGNMFRVLQEFAGLKVAELRDIRRQEGRYKEAVASIEAGDVLKGHDIFAELGWVKRVSDDKPLVEDYLAALATKRPGQPDRDRAIILAPTHAEGDAITAEVRRRLREAEKLGEERTYRQLVPLHWSEPERADLARYDGNEVLVFHQNSGTFRKGQVVRVADWKPQDRFSSAGHFAVYREGEIAVAAGDTLRSTANVRDTKGRRVDNGTLMTVTAVTPAGIEVMTGKNTKRTLPAAVGHVRHGYVATSIGAQGKTVDRVFAAMGSESLPALKLEQFYTDLSRGRHQATIYSDLPAAQLREAVGRADRRKSAHELLRPKPKPRRAYEAVQGILKKARERLRALQADRAADTSGHQRHKEREHAGHQR